MTPARSGVLPLHARPTRTLALAAVWMALSMALAALGGGLLSPTLLLAAAVGLPLAFVVVRWPVVGGAVMLFLLYTRISDVGIGQHGLPSIAQPYVFVLAALTFYRRTREGASRSLSAQAGLWCAVALYAAVLFLSSIWAVDASAAIRQATELLKNLLIAYIIAETFDTPAALRMGVWSLIAAGALLAGLSVLQAVTHTYGNTYWGLAQAPIRGITVGSTDHRSAGPIGDPNFYGLILVAIVPLALMRLRDERQGLLRLAAGLSILFLVAGLVLTYSRGDILTLGVALLAFVVLTRVRLAHIAVALVVVLPIAVTFVPASYWQRLSYLTTTFSQSPGAVSDASLNKRAAAGEVALAIFGDHPFLGVGADNYSEVYFPYARQLNVPDAASYSHDIYLQVAAETGLLGLIPYLAALFLALRAAWRGRRAARRARDSLWESLSTSCLLALITYLFGLAFLPGAYPRYLWLLVGLATAAAACASRRTVPYLEPLPLTDDQEHVGSRTPAPRPFTVVGGDARAPRGARSVSLGGQILRGGILSYGSFLVSRALVFLSTLVLARLLAPKDFGLVGLALLIVGFLDVAKNLGVTSALIFRQDIADEDADEVFVLNLLSGLVFFGLCWVLSPLAAAFFYDGRVTALTRVLGFSFVLSGLGGVHLAILQRQMNFLRRLMPDLLQSLLKGVVSISLALAGVGYWSLVWGQLAGIAVSTLAAWALWPWIPALTLRWRSARGLLAYGLHITAIDLLGVTVGNIDYVIVGRLLGKTPLGLYTMAYTIPQMLTLSLSIALSRVLFPAYARVKGDPEKLRQGYLSVLRYSTLALVPVGLGLFAVAPALVHTLYNKQWWPAVPALQALAIYASIFAIGWNAGDIWKATGRPDIVWKLTIGQAVVLAPALLLGAHLGGFVGVAVMQIAVVMPYSLVRFWLTRRAIGLRFSAIAAALRVPLMAGLCMLVVCLGLGWVVGARLAPPVVLVAQVALGGGVYALVVHAMDPEIRRQVMAQLGRRRVPMTISVPVSVPAEQVPAAVAAVGRQDDSSAL
jgi:PST family polysaccharide transporter